MAENMALRSGDDQTLLMIAAASSDKMAFKTCVEALRVALTPHDVSTNDHASPQVLPYPVERHMVPTLTGSWSIHCCRRRGFVNFFSSASPLPPLTYLRNQRGQPSSGVF